MAGGRSCETGPYRSEAAGGARAEWKCLIGSVVVRIVGIWGFDWAAGDFWYNEGRKTVLSDRGRLIVYWEGCWSSRSSGT